VGSVVWPSAFNQILCAFLILTAFYARLRLIETGEGKWKWIEAAAYLLGFGALEVIVLYPVIVLIHSWVTPAARKHARAALWMLAPAVIFGIARLFLFPKPTGPYQVSVDGRIFGNLWQYVLWAAGPSRMRIFDPE